MSKESVKIFFGPNPYSTSPILIYKIELDKSVCLIGKKVCFQIINYFPKYFSNLNFNNLESKVYIGMVLSHLAKHLINNNNGCIQNAGTTTHSEGLFIWVGFHYLNVTHQAIKLVLYIFQSLINGNNLHNKNIQTALNSFKLLCNKFHLASKPLLEIAQYDNIPMFPYLSNNEYWQFGWGRQSIIFMNSSSMNDSYHGVKDSMNKATSIEILRSIGVPTAKSVAINKIQELEKAVQLVGYPCVIKPIRGTQGIGITANIQNYDELQIAYKYAKKSQFGQNSILVEAFIEGDDHRIMVANGQFQGLVKRKASYVVGDGKSTIKELINNLNEKRANVELNPNHLKSVIIDDFLITHLNRQTVSLDDIIEKDKIITLSNIANYSSGGIVEDVTDFAHAQIKDMAELISQSSGIANLGIDYITTDITKPYHEVNGAVTEYNHHPHLGLVSFLSNPKDTLRNILNIGSGRIPLIIAIINSSHFIQTINWCRSNLHKKTTGWRCADNVYIGQLSLEVTDTSGWETVKMLLRNKTLEQALLVCSDKEIMEKGLPVDKADYICLCEIDLTSEWGVVIKKATPKIKKFTDIKILLSSISQEMEV